MQHDGEEIALIDVREHLDFGKCHYLYATCIPLSRLEVMAEELLPCLQTRIVLVDDEHLSQSSLAERAAEVLKIIGYLNVAVLDGGIRCWSDTGGGLYSGINVFSKAFGEFVLEKYITPLLDAVDLNAKINSQEKVVILDVRPRQEYEAGTIPGAINVPGVELVYRLHDIVSDPTTKIIVTCGGRTRSIIGAQSLINAGVPHQVTALENGTLGWAIGRIKFRKESESSFTSPFGCWCC